MLATKVTEYSKDITLHVHNYGYQCMNHDTATGFFLFEQIDQILFFLKALKKSTPTKDYYVLETKMLRGKESCETREENLSGILSEYRIRVGNERRIWRINDPKTSNYLRTEFQPVYDNLLPVLHKLLGLKR